MAIPHRWENTLLSNLYHILLFCNLSLHHSLATPAWPVQALFGNKEIRIRMEGWKEERKERRRVGRNEDRFQLSPKLLSFPEQGSFIASILLYQTCSDSKPSLKDLNFKFLRLTKLSNRLNWNYLRIWPIPELSILSFLPAFYQNRIP